MRTLAIASCFILACGVVLAQSDHKEPVAIIELGGATSWNVNGGSATFAPDFAVETTPVENWLELELGTTPYFSQSSTEWDTDLLFKKPWTLSEKAEFMLGVGPEWVHKQENHGTTNSLSLEFAGDFMFWPTGRHKYGWYLEPVYDYELGRGHGKSIGMSSGVLIAFP